MGPAPTGGQSTCPRCLTFHLLLTSNKQSDAEKQKPNLQRDDATIVHAPATGLWQEPVQDSWGKAETRPRETSGTRERPRRGQTCGSVAVFPRLKKVIIR